MTVAVDHADVYLASGGMSLALVTPVTAEARAWIEENVSDERTWFGHALVCEHRYLEDLITGMEESGLRVR